MEIIFFSSDIAKVTCIMFEIRMEIVGQGWKDPTPVNLQSSVKHLIKYEPKDMEVYGSVKYQIRSRSGN